MPRCWRQQSNAYKILREYDFEHIILILTPNIAHVMTESRHFTHANTEKVFFPYGFSLEDSQGCASLKWDTKSSQKASLELRNSGSSRKSNARKFQDSSCSLVLKNNQPRLHRRMEEFQEGTETLKFGEEMEKWGPLKGKTLLGKKTD